MGAASEEAPRARRSLRVMVNTASTFKGGGVQVARSLIEEWSARGDHRFLVVLSSALDALVDRHMGGHSMAFRALGYRPAERVIGPRDPAADLKRLEAEFQPDVVITTSGPAYWRPRAPHLMGFNLPHYLYPESPFFSRLIGRRERLKWRLKGRVLRHFATRDADAYVVQTDDINERLRRWLGTDRVFTVANTVSSYFRERDPVAPPSADELRVLVLSAAYRHKHLEILDEIIGILRAQGCEDVKFITTLDAEDLDALVQPAHRDWIENVGPQPPHACPPLYDQSHALFLPSLLECFSANYVEAMVTERPIVTTDLGFARTVCGDAALYFPAMDAAAALRQLDRLKEDAGLRDALVAKGRVQARRFGTAAERAERFLALCDQLVPA